MKTPFEKDRKMPPEHEATSLLDDKLGRMIRAADPARAPQDLGDSPRGQRVLHSILAAPRHKAPVVRRRWVLAPIAAGAALVVAALVIPFGSTPASAAIPLPLTISEPSLTLTQTLARIDHALATSPGVSEPLREASSLGWYIKIDGDVMQIEKGPIIPQRVTTTWAEDLSGRILAVTGEPYYPGRAEAVQEEGVPKPGTVLFDAIYPPGTFDTFSNTVYGDSEADMRAFLADFGWAPNRGAAAMASDIFSILWFWTLTNAQHRTLLHLLAGTGELSLAGTATDRSGRDVIVFRTVRADGQFERLLLVSAQTGRIVGEEVTRLKAYGGIPAGTLMSYKLLEVAP